MFNGDFNHRVKEILISGRIKRKTAVFALLDQRNTECHWSTVKQLADYKGRTRIEILYFLGVGWLHRSLTQSKLPERIQEIERWWGGTDWKHLTSLTRDELGLAVAERFQTELGYKYANAWPIFLREDGGPTAFTLIHASDHPQAPKLMRRAYTEVVGDRAGTPADSQRSMF